MCVLVIERGGRNCYVSACVLVSMCARYCHVTDERSCARACACERTNEKVYG